MKTASGKPLDWIEQVDRVLLELEEKPQFGLPLSFDWGGFEKMLQDLMNNSLLKMEHLVKGWVHQEKRWAGLGENPLFLTIHWAPLDSPAYFATTDQDLKRLMADLLGGEKETAYFYDPSLVQSFYVYFAAEILRLLQRCAFAAPLSPRLEETKDPFQEIADMPCFIIDVSFSLHNQAFWGKILLPENFRRDWKRYFSTASPPALSEELREKIMVDIGLEIGHTQLSLTEWKNVKEGDCILLDHCSYDPMTCKGGVILKLNQTPLFRGRFKESGIKLTEYPIYEEVSAAMEEDQHIDDDLEDDSDLEDFDIAEEEVHVEEHPHVREAPLIAPEELPVSLTVEVGRLRMTAKELMNLAPGNLLEVNTAPEQGVDLVVNGKKVGKGELIRLGEALGVRILSL